MICDTVSPKRTQNVASDATRVQAEQKSDLEYLSRREQSGVSCLRLASFARNHGPTACSGLVWGCA